MADQKNASANAGHWGAALASFFNGCFGDYLDGRNNGLAIDMAFYQNNRPLELTPEALGAVLPAPTGKLCVLVHGLCCNEWSWDFPDEPARSYGSALQHDLGYTPFLLRYNTGLPIPYNGQLLDELLLISHSMGGLVLRAACHYGAARAAEWVGKVNRVFYIVTPHEGAGLEQFAHLMTKMLHADAASGDGAGRRHCQPARPGDQGSCATVPCSMVSTSPRACPGWKAHNIT